eukprot:GILK01003745.1.p1 GENE.GILK01003745.1~~GILK01003745.1.p1  ORF type:complete len:143 (-),score=11.31 GILK01003745.1:180-566(-)
MSAVQVIMATSFDERHPPESILDGRDSTFWVSTGLYPQELLVQFDAPASIRRVKLTSTGIRRIIIEGCEGSSPVNFEKLTEQDLTDRSGRLQNETISLTSARSLRFLKLIISSGWSDFCSIHKLSVEA